MMTSNRKTRRRRKPAKPIAARLLLIALAVGGTFSGWAVLARQAIQSSADRAAMISAPVPAGVTASSAIPTVIPVPATIRLNSAPQTAVLQPVPAGSQRSPLRPLMRTRSSR